MSCNEPSVELSERDRDRDRVVVVRVVTFGAVRDVVGSEEIHIAADEPATSGSVLDSLILAYPSLEKLKRSLFIAVNQEYAARDTPVRDGDEVAIFPPVSGGRGFDFFELSREHLDIGAIARRVVLPECGATVTLDGYVRGFTGQRRTLYLVYEAYEEMALREMEKLGMQAHERFDISYLGIVHRLGRLEIGETSVVIAAGAPHRSAAFQACKWAIRELKKRVPIWKKEFFEGGEMWVEGEGVSEMAFDGGPRSN